MATPAQLIHIGTVQPPIIMKNLLYFKPAGYRGLQEFLQA